MVRLTDGNFEEKVLRSELPVLVDFWASWCPPCKMVEPVLQEIAIELDGSIKVGRLHVDQNPRTASMYQVTGVPTFAVFNRGRVTARRVGSQSKAQLHQMLAGVT